MAILYCLSVLLLSVYFTSGCEKVIFFVDNLVLDKLSSDANALLSDFSVIDTSTECATKCGQELGCLSYFYNKESGDCRLYSALVKSTDVSLISSPGFVYYRPNCPVLVEDYVTNGATAVSFSGGQWSAKVTCNHNAIFVGSSQTVTCDVDGFWPAMGICALVQWVEPSVPFFESIPFTVSVGTRFGFIGRSFGTQFVMRLWAGSDIALTMKATSDGQVERSSEVSSVAQGLVSAASPDFYKPPKDFKCFIVVEEKGLTAATGDSTLFTHEHIVDYSTIDKLEIIDDVELKQVKIIP